MPRLLEVEDYKVWARNDLPTVDNSVIEDGILAAEQSLDNACHRRIELGAVDINGDVDLTAATVRLFRPYDRSTLLFIDDCTAVTAISENSSALDDDYWQLEPLNGRSKAGELVPYDSVRCIYRYWFHNGAIPISVSAVWGWPGWPTSYSLTLKILTKAHLDGRDIRAGIAGFSPDGFAVSEREAKVVRQFVRDYSLRHSLVG